MLCDVAPSAAAPGPQEEDAKKQKKHDNLDHLDNLDKLDIVIVR